MKKLTLCIVLTLFWGITVSAAEFPPHSMDFPATDVVIEKGAVELIKQHLTITFSNKKLMGSSPVEITSTYIMRSAEDSWVKMIYPFMDTIDRDKDIEITVNGSPVEHEAFPIYTIMNYSSGYQPYFSHESKKNLDVYEYMLSRLNGSREVKKFSGDTEVVIYDVTIENTTNENIIHTYTTTGDFNKRLVVEQYHGGRAEDPVSSYHEKIEPGISQFTTLAIGEVVVDIGDEQPGLNISVSKSELTLKDYLFDFMDKYLPLYNEEALYYFFLDHVNTYTGTADRGSFNNGYTRETGILLAHDIFFPAESEVEVVVKSRANTSHDARKSKSPVQIFDYLFQRNWANFGELVIDVYGPDRAPYLISSTIPLEEINQKHYRGEFKNLPSEDLVIKFYEHEIEPVTIGEAILIIGSSPLLYIFILGVVAIVVLGKRRKDV